MAIRGLLWRSHPALVRFNQDANRVLSTLVNRAGGQLVADQQVRRFGSHHQKLLVVHLPNDPGRCIAFVGGIDLSRGRADDPDHRGDADPVRIDPRYGRRPPWHDLQLELHGPAVLDVDLTFRERWEDRTPMDHRNPLRAMWRRVSHEPRRRELLQRRLPPPRPDQAVQVLRTYRPGIGRSRSPRMASAASPRATSRPWGGPGRWSIEDQYLWGSLVSDALAAALRAAPALRMIIVVPRYPTATGGSRAGPRGPPSGGHRQPGPRRRVAGGRVRPGERAGTPIYVHAKAIVIDDVWAMVGSANLNRRSWTHDSRSHARSSARSETLALPSTRAALATGPGYSPVNSGSGCGGSICGSDPTAERAGCSTRSQASSSGGRPRPGSRAGDGGNRGPRPPGRVRPHQVELASALKARWAAALYRVAIDPDGRPLPLRRDTSL